MAVSSKKKSKESEISVIDQPSLTWGIVPVPSEGKEKVIEFLEKEGIDTSELHDVELPNTIEVMQERIDFLKKLGLSLDVINSYPLMVTCSIKKNLVPVLDYLEQLGLRSKDLPKFVEKYPMVLHSSVIIDLMPVVDYLLGLDIQRKDIIRVLMRYPDVLGFRLEGTMSTSVAYIVSLGVRMRCIGRMLTEYPEILGMRVGNNIKPKVDFLLSYGIPKPVIAKLLEVRPYILGFDLIDNMQSVVDDLLEAGVRKEGIANIITQYPDILGQDIKQNLAQKCIWLMQQVAVQAEGVPVIFENLPQILFIKEGLAMERVRFFRNAGLSAEDVALMVVECPQILALSIEHTIQPSLNFLLHDMKRSVKEVVKFPSYFTYDLKSRIMPRYKLITEKGIDCSLEWFLNCTDQRLKGRLSDEYLDNDAPGPVFQMGGVVHTEIKPLDENLHSDMAEKGKKDEQQSPYLNQRQTSMSHQWERKLYTTSDSDIENSSGNENESDMYEAYSELEEDSDEDDDGILSSLRGLRNTNKAVDVRKQQKASDPSLESMSEEGDYSENDFTDDAQDILRARLHDDEDLEMLESASDSEFHEGVVDDSMVDDDWSISEDEEEQYNERWKRNI
ncbi:hypothetical protein KP509_13G090900 [Ceratopteris richardii]|nr:hypothetical protein KP509_13G090900 [Ceratopteris richardii]